MNLFVDVLVGEAIVAVFLSVLCMTRYLVLGSA